MPAPSASPSIARHGLMLSSCRRSFSGGTSFSARVRLADDAARSRSGGARLADPAGLRHFHIFTFIVDSIMESLNLPMDSFNPPSQLSR